MPRPNGGTGACARLRVPGARQPGGGRDGREEELHSANRHETRETRQLATTRDGTSGTFEMSWDGWPVAVRATQVRTYVVRGVSTSGTCSCGISCVHGSNRHGSHVRERGHGAIVRVSFTLHVRHVSAGRVRTSTHMALVPYAMCEAPMHDLDGSLWWTRQTQRTGEQGLLVVFVGVSDGSCP